MHRMNVRANLFSEDLLCDVVLLKRRFWIHFQYLFSKTLGGPMHHSSGDHYYPSPHGPKEDRSWSPHMDSYEMMVSGHVSSFAYKKLKI